MARALSFRSSAICAIIARGLRGPVAIGTISAARSSTLNASSMRPALRRYSPSATCAWKLSGNAAAIASGLPFPGSSSFGGFSALTTVPYLDVSSLSKSACSVSMSTPSPAFSAASPSSPSP